MKLLRLKKKKSREETMKKKEPKSRDGNKVEKGFGVNRSARQTC